MISFNFFWLKRHCLTEDTIGCCKNAQGVMPVWQQLVIQCEQISEWFASRRCFSAHFIMTSKIRTVTPRPQAAGAKQKDRTRPNCFLWLMEFGWISLNHAWNSDVLESLPSRCLIDQSVFGFLGFCLCEPGKGQVHGRQHHPKDPPSSPPCASWCFDLALD